MFCHTVIRGIHMTGNETFSIGASEIRYRKEPGTVLTVSGEYGVAAAFGSGTVIGGELDPITERLADPIVQGALWETVARLEGKQAVAAAEEFTRGATGLGIVATEESLRLTLSR